MAIWDMFAPGESSGVPDAWWQKMGGGGASAGGGFSKVADLLSILGATLQDYNTAGNGGQGAALSAVNSKLQRLGDQKQYQDMLDKQFAPETTMQSPNISYDPATKSFNNAAPSTVGVQGGPGREALGPMADAMLPMLQGMSPQQGLPALFDVLQQGQERQYRQGERAEDRSWQLGDREIARRQQLEDDKRKRGYEVEDRSTLTAAQKAQIAIDQARLSQSRLDASKGPAPPSGYRPDGKGGLTFIPGGPADPAVAGRGTGKPTEDQAKNAQLYTLSKKVLPQVLENFDSLGTVGNAIGKGIGNMPFIGPGVGWTTSAGARQAETGLKSLVANFLYSTSGATATPQEVENRLATVMPLAGEDEATRALKKQAIIDMVESIKLRASPQLLGQSSEAAPASAPPKPAQRNGRYNPKTGKIEY